MGFYISHAHQISFPHVIEIAHSIITSRQTMSNRSMQVISVLTLKPFNNTLTIVYFTRISQKFISTCVRRRSMCFVIKFFKRFIDYSRLFCLFSSYPLVSVPFHSHLFYLFTLWFFIFLVSLSHNILDTRNKNFQKFSSNHAASCHHCECSLVRRRFLGEHANESILREGRCSSRYKLDTGFVQRVDSNVSTFDVHC